MTILAAILLAIVQGITEFLPVSSSGHLAILQNIFKLSGTEGHLFFDVLLHFGTLVSICYVYRKDLRDMIQGCVNFARGDRENPADGQRMMPNVRMVVMIIISTLPLFLSGIVHFLEISCVARYRAFKSAVSLGNTLLCLFRRR